MQTQIRDWATTFSAIISAVVTNRGIITLQRPPKDFPEEGHIVVEIWVDREGNVVRTGIAKGTDITNSEMRNMAMEAAKRSKVAPDPTAPEEQKGTITYTFVQNQ